MLDVVKHFLFLFFHVFIRTIGMFEQNNVGVILTHPSAVVVQTLEPHDPLVVNILVAVEEISRQLEGDSRNSIHAFVAYCASDSCVRK